MPVPALYGVAPVVAIATVFPAGTYRRYRGTTTVTVLMAYEYLYIVKVKKDTSTVKVWSKLIFASCVCCLFYTNIHGCSPSGRCTEVNITVILKLV